ncbi:MAG TPA: hypothetical protein VFS20_04125 [Longimicrobium sp.]|nr:hypothetical protein [Longimicrobium sp.]
MRKLVLDLDTIAVDSFATADASEATAGSVHARELARTFTCDQTTPYCKTQLTYCPCTPRWDGI